MTDTPPSGIIAWAKKLHTRLLEDPQLASMDHRDLVALMRRESEQFSPQLFRYNEAAEQLGENAHDAQLNMFAFLLAEQMTNVYRDRCWRLAEGDVDGLEELNQPLAVVLVRPAFTELANYLVRESTLGHNVVDVVNELVEPLTHLRVCHAEFNRNPRNDRVDSITLYVPLTDAWE